MRRHAGVGDFSWAADSETDTREVLGSQFFNNIRDTVVAGSARRVGEFVGTGGDIEIVMEDDDILGLELVEMHELTDGGAGSIHEGRGLYEEYLVFADSSLAYFRRHFFVMLKRAVAPFLLEKVQTEEAGIVSRVCVIVARVAESDDELHELVSCVSCMSFV